MDVTTRRCPRGLLPTSFYSRNSSLWCSMMCQVWDIRHQVAHGWPVIPGEASTFNFWITELFTLVPALNIFVLTGAIFNWTTEVIFQIGVFQLAIESWNYYEWFQFWLPSILLFSLIKQDFRVSYDALELNKDKYTKLSHYY